MGGPQIFEPFMPAYFSHFRYKSLSTNEFMDFLYSWFIENHGESMRKKLDAVEWNKWLYGRGMPPVTPQFDMTLATPCYNLATRWTKAAAENEDPQKLDFKKSDIENWIAGQLCMSCRHVFSHLLTVGVFLEQLDDLPEMLEAKYIVHMAQVYELSSSRNAEIISRFYIIAMKSRWEQIYGDVAKFLANVGRMKFVRPGYRGLNEVNRELAVKTFRQHEMFYHPICRAMVKKDLKLD